MLSSVQGTTNDRLNGAGHPNDPSYQAPYLPDVARNTPAHRSIPQLHECTAVIVGFF